ncbi:MAG: bifunctional phosphopantothenoylcysteine decarboxylase/phosphopantothenate--cysteine ligase CoaBC [Atopobiaceae bacterium]|nr:bifunctional phosphopantothenoylcysteine decarboxylase/phosphopantothenate--cysteine ligase CoaBC [Atopobiaceae bacterium]
MAREHTEAPRVLMVVCGGIAAYKATEVLRLLQRAEAEVRVVCTEDALRFVGAATWEGLTHHRVAHGFYDWPESAIPHVELAGWAHAVLVVPATANFLAKMATGLGDDLASATVLATPQGTPILVAPAMNVHMWRSAATQHNIGLLEQRGTRVVQPVTGRLACEDVGEGKLANVDDIASAVTEALSSTVVKTLAGRHVVVTAGPTHEAIDPVRYIANASSGKMGYAIAGELAQRGARVSLVSGPVALMAPAGVDRIDVISARQMFEATTQAFFDADAAICAAAVADYTPAHPADHKLKKAHEHMDRIELVETADILAHLGTTKHSNGRTRIVIGFAAETNDLLLNAQSKLERKGCDLIVANDVSRSDSGFGSNTNRVTLIGHNGAEELPTLTKKQVAARLVDWLEGALLGS